MLAEIDDCARSEIAFGCTAEPEPGPDAVSHGPASAATATKSTSRRDASQAGADQRPNVSESAI